MEDERDGEMKEEEKKKTSWGDEGVYIGWRFTVRKVHACLFGKGRWETMRLTLLFIVT
jgi:hypothetical protein